MIYSISQYYDVEPQTFRLGKNAKLPDLNAKASALFGISPEKVRLYYEDEHHQWTPINTQEDLKECQRVQQLSKTILLGISEQGDWISESQLILETLPEEGRKIFENYFALLQGPIVYEPIYRAAAQCLQWLLNSNPTMQVKHAKEKQWLTRMRHFLSSQLIYQKRSHEWFVADMRQTLYWLGIDLDSLPEDFPEPTQDERYWKSINGTYDLIKRLKFRQPPIAKLPNESQKDFADRLLKMKTIRSALLPHFQDLEQMLWLSLETACSQPLLSHMMLKAGQIMECSLKLMALRHLGSQDYGNLSSHYYSLSSYFTLPQKDRDCLTSWNDYPSLALFEAPIPFKLASLEQKQLVPEVLNLLKIAHEVLEVYSRGS